MFSKKQKSLFERNASELPKKVENNAFVQAGMKESAKTTTLGNGALKYTTTGNDFVDQFGKISTYKNPRSFEEICVDMQKLWAQNPFMTLCLVFYIRMITRVVQLFGGSKTSETQRGQGLKHEGIFRMIWVALVAPDSFWKNISLFISIGSWKDVITMLSYDLQYNGWEGRKLDWNKFGQLILAGLENPNTSELVKKYLPQIKANSNCKTLEAQADNIIAKWICSLLFSNVKVGYTFIKENKQWTVVSNEGFCWQCQNKQHDSEFWTTEEIIGDVHYSKYKQYRKLKSSGTAHQWQQLISQGRLLEINFDTIHGRALAQLVSGKFLTNNGLEKIYEKWIDSKPVAKYTGYVYELFAPMGISQYAAKLAPIQEATINKQFLGLIETARNGMTEESNSLIVVIDSSGSMTSKVPGTKVSAYSVAKSMALYFSYLLKGPFQDHFLEFSDSTIMKTWKGETPIDKYRNERSAIVAGTNFQSVADHFGRILKTGVSEENFPGGILCISDGCFNHAGNNTTNVEALMKRLLSYGFSKEYVNNFKVVLWDIPNGYYGKPQTAFEEFANCPNLIHMSGLDPAIVAFLTGTKGQTSTPSSSEQLFKAAMSQEVFNMIEV